MTAFARTTAHASIKPLDDDEIVLVRLPYRREWRRDPLRRVLGRYLGSAAEDVDLIDDEHGRPSLAGEHVDQLRFNWSHSDDQALIALSRRIQPGVDLERLRARPRALDIAQRYFAPAEWARLNEIPPCQREVLFLKLWTAKEALLKAQGRGLAFGLHRVSVTIDQQKTTLTNFDGEDCDAWQLHPLPLGPDLVGALAWRGAPMKLRWDAESGR